MFALTYARTVANKELKQKPITMLRRFASSGGNKKKLSNNDSYFKNFTSDPGTYPLILANTAAVGFIVVFVGRKILYHPDVLISNDMRRPGIHNETESRDDYSDQYRNQTKFFANTLAPAAEPILQFFNGDLYSKDRFDLQFTRTNDETIDTPLEFTEHFHDGLFNGVKPQQDALPYPGQVGSI